MLWNHSIHGRDEENGITLNIVWVWAAARGALTFFRLTRHCCIRHRNYKVKNRNRCVFLCAFVCSSLYLCLLRQSSYHALTT